MQPVIEAREILKPWGYEIWLANNQEEDYCGKILYIKPGHSSSMHFHAEKHETFYILEGELRVEMIDTKTSEKFWQHLHEGDTFVIDRLVPHQLSPVGDSPVKFIEISTFHKDEDSYRVWK